MFPQQRFNFVGGTVATPDPHHFRWVAVKKAQLMKVRILGDDCKAVGLRALPDRVIAGATETNISSMAAAWKDVGK